MRGSPRPGRFSLVLLIGLSLAISACTSGSDPAATTTTTTTTGSSTTSTTSPAAKLAFTSTSEFVGLTFRRIEGGINPSATNGLGLEPVECPASGDGPGS
jgi:hypothetical protein